MILCKKEKLVKYFKEYLLCENFNLFYCYHKPSYKKIEIFDNIKFNLKNKFKCYNFKILSHNNNIFTVGCLGTYNGKDAFFYITKDYDRVMYLD